MFCSECGEKNAANAKFCKNCGQALKDNKKGSEPTKEVKKINSFFQDLLNNLKAIFVKPVSGGKEFIKEDNYISGLIYLGVNVIVIGFLVMAILKLAYSMLFGAFSSDLMFSGMAGDTFKLPYFKSFVVAILFGALYYCIIAGLIYVFSNYVFKSKTSFKKALAWLGYNSILNTLALLVVIFFVLLDAYNIAIIIYLLVSILYIYNLIKTLEYVTDTKEDMLGYVLTPTIGIAAFVVYYILPKLFF